MEYVFLNGKIVPAAEARISPDDRGFLFADGIYEVVRWYGRGFFDMDGHLARLKRSLNEVQISQAAAEYFPGLAADLLEANCLLKNEALVYLQVTRGAARRSHAFPDPPVPPTVYAFARELKPDRNLIINGISAMTTDDIRWSRCDIKSIALLPNILRFQEARENNCHEIIFRRNGKFTECGHSNIFFVKNGTLITHPESNFILSGISRKNIIRLALAGGIEILEEALGCEELNTCQEVFITNTSFEIAPVTYIDGMMVADGRSGQITGLLREKFDLETATLKNL